MLIKDWNIPIDASFTMIKNDDSIQFINKDRTRILYFSVLLVKGEKSLIGDSFKIMEPKISETKSGWELKGAKDAGHKVLVFVLSFTDKVDEQWALNFFNSIFYIGK